MNANVYWFQASARSIDNSVCQIIKFISPYFFLRITRMKADAGFEYAGVKPAATIANCLLHTANWDIACDYRWLLRTANCQL